MTWRAVIADRLAVQPNMQYVINPNADRGIKNATVLGIRFEMSLEN